MLLELAEPAQQPHPRGRGQGSWGTESPGFWEGSGFFPPGMNLIQKTRRTPGKAQCCAKLGLGSGEDAPVPGSPRIPRDKVSAGMVGAGVPRQWRWEGPGVQHRCRAWQRESLRASPEAEPALTHPQPGAGASSGSVSGPAAVTGPGNLQQALGVLLWLSPP